MNATTRFTTRAADYAANRPTYGDDALAFVLDGLPRPLVVADLGAGTGISARLLAERGADVLAIEPNAAMRAQAAPHERVRFIDATADATGLGGASVDCVTAFQAFHWFADTPTLAEIRRILRPGGRAALVLNERDERDACTAAYGDVYRAYAVDDTEARRLASIAVFTQLSGTQAEREFYQVQRLDREGFWRRTISSSYMPHTGGDAERLRADVDALFDRHAQDGAIAIALRTIVVRVDLARG